MSTIAASYVLPLRASAPDPELRDYVRWLAETVADVLVVDASPSEVRTVHEGWWSAGVTHLPPDPARRCRNGKVWGVLTGLDRARHDVVVIADDDVRWDRDGLRRVVGLLASTDLVAPANYYDPLPWPARYDTGRILVQRALGGDWPGTLALRRQILAPAGGGYDGDVLFENLELVRTVTACGGRCAWPLDLLVARRPPTARHLLGQRVRQAYDEFARPAHLVTSLAVLPVVLAGLARRRPALPAAVLLAAICAAWRGRRHGEGARVYPLSSVLLAPLWVVERSITVWIALVYRLRGGIPYAGSRMARAGSAVPQLRRRVAADSALPAAAAPAGREPTPGGGQ
ncbi:MAG: glycosyltransferase [Pseudonocardia sp.]|nr:glycosyltransferase [Pseudonocardia sp.]